MKNELDMSRNKSSSASRWVVMGVCGCGKTEIGRRLATALELPFVEGDAYHPSTNVAKMAAGIPLGDEDRVEWLQCLKEEIAGAKQRGAGLVLSCSALKRAYRDLLREADPDLVFVHLTGDRDLIASRMRARTDHFMPLSLLDSQMLALQPLQTDETGFCLDISQNPDTLIKTIVQP